MYHRLIHNSLHFRFLYVEELGHRLTQKSVNVKEVQETLASLKEEQVQLKQHWDAKQHFLEDMLEEQLFNREADHIDAATKGHEAFLDLGDLGVSQYWIFEQGTKNGAGFWDLHGWDLGPRWCV